MLSIHFYNLPIISTLIEKKIKRPRPEDAYCVKFSLNWLSSFVKEDLVKVKMYFYLEKGPSP